MFVEYIVTLIAELVKLVPRIAGAIIVLVVGWIAGRLLGRGIAKLLDKVGLDDALRKTAIGKALDRTKITIVGFFDLAIRWFVYLIAVLAAVDILQITILSGFISQIVQYLPRFIGGVFVLLIGFLVADFVGDSLRAIGKEGKLEYATIFADGLRILLYFVVLVIGLSTMQIETEILYIFAKALAWSVAAGVALGLGIAFGWGFKDAIAKRADKWIDTVTSASKNKQK